MRRTRWTARSAARCFNSSQQVRADAPFLLVLAGTPGLPDRLREMDASFWSRLGEGLLGVGRLDDAAARAALSEPLQAHGVGIDADALDAVIEHSQRYPYFIQLWGDALWKQRATTDATRIDAAAIASARPKVVAQVTDYYRSRYDELHTEGVLAAAMAVARIFQARMDATAQEHELGAALAKAGFKNTTSRRLKLQALNRLGYVWRPPGQMPPIAWSAGIPSLMTFVLESREQAKAVRVGTRFVAHECQSRLFGTINPEYHNHMATIGTPNGSKRNTETPPGSDAVEPWRTHGRFQ